MPKQIKLEQIAIGIIVTTVLLIIASGFYSYRLATTNPPIYAKAFATKIGASYIGCQSFDSDQDGYVTCSVQPDAQAPLTIQCAIGILNSDQCYVGQPRSNYY